MRKLTATAAFAAAGVAVLGAAASPAMAQNSGVAAGDVSLVNLDASSLAHWQICGQNILAQSYGQVCDNRDHIGEDGPQSGVWAGDVSGVNADLSSALHWQICGQNVLTQSFGQVCDNADHISEDEHDYDKGHDQGDY
ncbi:hypothetical protein [Glycomyces algeriensis]|jgi:hypothetical protein|uniref:Secreted protein n=1 Tax=Glycomyces algeriensis TaxID=256037 RepID=A0A9W6LF45_9ACTN|nr:hypothetical protein [Glycomyces algeriensis]MDA1368143.1 hypothetical protein [Glycomyces algeriensis]MDR7348874.1 hypothetical protein [Glycomyces algeriensis]GLI41577.1 hypothetical protein GALLR39Z86_14270 [Glycomyces algeriensis]